MAIKLGETDPQSAQHVVETHRDRWGCREWMQRQGEWASAPRCELICLAVRLKNKEAPEGLVANMADCIVHTYNSLSH